MSFEDEGVILSARPYGENHALADIFTAAHGRWTSLVHGGQGRRMGPILQPGNGVKVEWRGRGESVGYFSLELVEARAAGLLGDRLALAGLNAALSVAAACLPEREPHPRAWRALTILLGALDAADVWPALMARWELGLLAELGFGLTLDRCAATGRKDDLVYVSPRSACAVSAEAGAPYKDKLLPLPDFLRGGSTTATRAEAVDALKTTGYFIETRILHLANRPLPDARVRIAEILPESAQ